MRKPTTNSAAFLGVLPSGKQDRCGGKGFLETVTYHLGLAGVMSVNALISTIIGAHSWVCSHVKFVFVFVGYAESVPLVEVTRGINLNNRQRNSL
jgi:hypothetical protein